MEEKKRKLITFLDVDPNEEEPKVKKVLSADNKIVTNSFSVTKVMGLNYLFK